MKGVPGKAAIELADVAERTRRCFEHWNARRLDDILGLMHQDVTWDMRPVGLPDMGLYRGHAGVRRFWAGWLEVFPDAAVEVESIRAEGSWGLGGVLQKVQGGSSGAPVDFRYAGIGLWEDGRLLAVENYTDLAQARMRFGLYVTGKARPDALGE